MLGAGGSLALAGDRIQADDLVLGGTDFPAYLDQVDAGVSKQVNLDLTEVL